MTDPSSHPRQAGQGLRLTLPILLLVAMLAAGALLTLKPHASSEDFAGSSPHWIWDSSWPRNPTRAHAFAVEREYEVPATPETARLLIAADEEYHLYWNDEWVGSGTYRSGTWDAYVIAPKLVMGPNRVRVELRSGRGVGGLLVCLQAAPGDRCRLASDDGWRVVPADGTAERPVLDWGAAPIGSWPLPQGLRARYRIDECLARAKPVEARHVFDLEDRLYGGEHHTVTLPVRTVRWGPRAKGIVEFDVDPSDRRVGLLAYGRNRGIPAQREWVEEVVTEPGQVSFRSATARQLRFVEIDGIDEVPAGRYYPIRDRCSDWLFEEPQPIEGLFGLDPPPSRTPVENELWGEF